MAVANITWGEEKIAHELLVKLGVRVSPRTVRKYIPIRERDAGPNRSRHSVHLAGPGRRPALTPVAPTDATKTMLAYITGLVDQELLSRNEYLVA